MCDSRHWNGLQPPVRSVYRATLYIWMMWAHVAAANDKIAAAPTSSTTHVALIPSAPRPLGLIPPESADVQSITPPQTGLIPSQSRPPVLIPSQPQTFIITSQAGPPSALPQSTLREPGGGIIPSAPPSLTNLPPSSIISSGPIISSNATSSGFPNGNFTGPVPSMPTSSDQALKPIPAPSSDPGSPDGHHEIPEPGLVGPCRNCNPDMQLPATGFNDGPSSNLPTSSPHVIAEPQQSPAQPKSPQGQVTITVGPSNVVIRPSPTGQGNGNSGESGGDGSGGGGGGGGTGGGGVTGGEPGRESDDSSSGEDIDFVIGDSATVRPGQTITIENTPIVIQTTAGRTEVILGGTQTIPFERPAQALITNPPSAPLPVAIDSQTLTPIFDSNKKPSEQTPTAYVIQGQTLVPGGKAITIQGTVFSLPTTPTAIVVNGQTTTITPAYGAVISTTTIPLLTLFQSTFTANAAGNYVIAPGTTLRPGGEAITVSGTVISLKPGNTEVVVQGSTSQMVPATTVVTVTRSGGSVGGGGFGGENNSPSGSAAEMLPYPAGVGRMSVLGLGLGGPLEGVFALGAVTVGWLAVWL
ncbi:unnamed protein product [Periconia digitata]|uniref:Uncharacterized protein n=1 Tax=Periconia digitata TaxID=1303443 RepID=A0A9W4XYE7_9PLEO|nr:unnamed protein product [Periconia digitata]